MKPSFGIKSVQAAFLLMGTVIIALVILSLRPIYAECISAQDAGALQKEHAKLLKKLRSLTISDFELHNATPKEAVRLLAEESIKADPEHRGISFIAQFNPGDAYRRITVNLHNASIKQVLEHLFTYSVGDSTVSVEFFNGDGLFSRTFTFLTVFFFLGQFPLVRLGNKVMT